MAELRKGTKDMLASPLASYSASLNISYKIVVAHHFDEFNSAFGVTVMTAAYLSIIYEELDRIEDAV